MNQEQRIENCYREIFNDDFINTHGFERYRFGAQEFFAAASTLRSKSGREITVSFNIHDEQPDELELVMQFLNKSSLEQIKTIAESIAIDCRNEINIYEETNCISLVSYFALEEVDRAIEMMKVILERVNKVVLFVLNND